MPRAASTLLRGSLALLLVLAVMLGNARLSLADMRREGDWPAENQELVSFSAAGLPRAEAIQRLADKVGWSVVVDSPSPGNVDVRVTKQPAARVLELLLGSGDFIARRQSSLVSITRRPATAAPAQSDAAAPAPSSAAPPSAASVSPSSSSASGRGRDRVVTGQSVIIKSAEIVHDLAIFGGSAQVYGRVTGDASVFGGSLTVEPGGHVEGDLTTFGGSVHLKDGARLDGDVTALGGSVKRDSKAIVGEADDESTSDTDPDDDDEKGSGKSNAARRVISFGSVASSVGSAITRTALLFAFGVILWALSNRRIEALQTEVIARPMRAFAIGSVALIAALAFVVALCVTLVGIPLALVAVSVAVFGAYAGVCAALTAAGAALLRHKTSSPYVHLGVGCVLYLLLSSIPFVGTFVTVIVVLVGFGALVATRAAGFVPRHGATSG